ncbi:MAG: dimethylsulfonioproprionate lyase family protein [Pseudomonadota bacterium]
MTALANLLEACRALHAAIPGLCGFAPWPDDLTPTGLTARHRPATDQIAAIDDPTDPLSRTATEAVRAAAGDLHWRRYYTEADVGADMMARYAFVELFGPKGHFHSDQGRGFIGYWGHDLAYDWHGHEAEELYVCLSGRGLFKAEGEADVWLNPGDLRLHKSRQSHAMDTGAEPFLGFIMWRGNGMSGAPAMHAA